MTNEELIPFNWYNNTPKTRFVKVDNRKYTPFVEKSLDCYQCGNTVYRPNDNKWVDKCNRCGNILYFFKPTPIQLIASLAQTNILFNIGAVGSGKTTISAYIWSMLIRMIPKSKLIAAAQTMDQLIRNAVPELDRFFHESEFDKKTKDIWKFKNGAVAEWWASDDPDKLRSANANFIWLVEANTPQMHEFFNEAMSRLRNQAGLVYEYNDDGTIKMRKTLLGIVKPVVKQNRNLIIVEGNPKRGAWFNNAILQAHTIFYTTHVKGIPSLKARAKPQRSRSEFTGEDMNVDMVGILNASFDNPMLDDKYFQNMRASVSSEEEYNQKLYCDITSQDGLVFKNVVDNPHEYFQDIQQINWFDKDLAWVETLDPGGSNAANDPDAYILGVFNKQTRRLQLIDGFKISGLTQVEVVKRITDLRRKWGWRRDRSLVFVADNALGKSYKSNRNQSLKTDYEIRLATAITLCNDKNIASGLSTLKTWFNYHSIVMNRGPLDFLIGELYGYEQFEVKVNDKFTDGVRLVTKFTETNNHAIDALRYLVVMLEGMGYRQDQAMIDYARRAAQTGTYFFDEMDDYDMGIPASKLDLQQYLPTPGTTKNSMVQSKKTKFKL